MTRAGLIAVEREVTRSGRTHSQRFWIREGGFKDKLTREGAAAVESKNPEVYPEHFDENAERVFGKKITPDDLRSLMRPPPGYTVKIDHVDDERVSKMVPGKHSEALLMAERDAVRTRFAADYPGEEMPAEESIQAQALSNLGPPRSGLEYSEAVLVAARLHDRSGTEVGRITRQFMREPSGELAVEHVGLFLNEDQQGKGVGVALTRNAFEEYRKIGVSKVTLTAAAVGRYTWARFGFNWDKEHAEHVRQEFPKALEKAGMPPAEARAVADRHADRAWEIASVKVGDRKVGKEYLRNGAGWRGELSLRDGDPGFEVAKGRLGL